MAKTYTITMNGMNFTAPTQAEAIAMAKEFCNTPTKAHTGKGKAKTVEYHKDNGTVVMATPAQAKAWDAWKSNGKDRVSKEEALAQWASKRDAYKPSKALKDAIKANRAAITLAVAKEKYDFVGTKKDLATLKDSICK